jgi:uncharacterized coiled-coil protein SlyX
LRARIAELEHQQVECEEKLAAMVIQAQEYAVRLEQAQDTIHHLSEPKLQDDDDTSISTSHHSAYPSSSSYSNLSQDGMLTHGNIIKETEITKV